MKYSYTYIASQIQEVCVGGGGHYQPPVHNKIGGYFLKNKKMQNVLKRKNMYLEGSF